MTLLERHLEAARASLAPNWDDARAERVEADLPQRARRRRRARVLGVASLLVAALLTAALSRPREAGTIVEPLGSGVVVELPGRSGQQAFEVSDGTVRFVARPGGAPVRVVAGAVEVMVRDTRVLVERAATRARVEVEEGSVQVRWPGGTSQLEAGEQRWFPPEVPPPLATPSPPGVLPTAAPPPKVKHERAPPPAAASPGEPDAPPGSAPRDWKELAHAGDYAAAWESLHSTSPADDPDELLLAADVARLTGHAEASVVPLRRVVDAHATDARAPLAAFTLGRVLLDDLGRPAEAASAFETARTLAPTARLSEDALARQVEAAFRAQDPRARALAERFVKDFPSSARLRAVRYFGGLEK